MITSVVGGRFRHVATKAIEPCRTSCSLNTSAYQSRRRLLGAGLLSLPILADQSLATAEQPSSRPLPIEEVQDRLIKCFVDGQYYVSGKLDRGIFTEDCFFTDPTVRVKGTEKYAAAVAAIFSPETSSAGLITCEITGPNTIELTWRLAGVITQGGRVFKFKPYTGKTVYTTDAATGRIERQAETWDISTVDVFVSLFFPGFGAPPAAPVEDLRAQRARA